MSTQCRFVFGHVFLAHQGRGFERPTLPSGGQLRLTETPSCERRDSGTLEGLDGVSEVIKLVIKLHNRGGGEGGAAAWRSSPSPQVCWWYLLVVSG